MPSDNPFKEIATLLDGRINKHISLAVSGVHADLGTITETGVKLDGFKHEINDYLKQEGISFVPGDRVLCVPVGSEIVVVCKVV